MSLYQEMYPGEDFSEQDFFEAVRYVFPETEGFHENQIEEFIMETVSQMSPLEAENFWRKIGNFAKRAGRGILKVASVAAPIVGTAVGGPLGTMIGGVAGNLAGAAANAIPRGRSRRRRGGSRRSRRRRNPALQRAWNQTRQTAANLGRSALSGMNQYARENPYQGSSQSGSQGSPMTRILSRVINNPAFQTRILGSAYGNGNPGEYYESDIEFLEMMESLNYLTENILDDYESIGISTNAESYEGNEEDELSRINRIEDFIEDLLDFEEEEFEFEESQC